MEEPCTDSFPCCTVVFLCFLSEGSCAAVGKAPHRFLSLQFPTPRAPLRNLPESTITDVAPQKQSRQRWQPQEQDAGSPCPRSLLPAAGPSRDPSVGKEKGERGGGIVRARRLARRGSAPHTRGPPAPRAGQEGRFRRLFPHLGARSPRPAPPAAASPAAPLREATPGPGPGPRSRPPPATCCRDGPPRALPCPPASPRSPPVPVRPPRAPLTAPRSPPLTIAAPAPQLRHRQAPADPPQPPAAAPARGS